MSSESYQAIDVNVPWIFIPLGHDDALGICLWIRRHYPSPEADGALASDCETAIKAAFEKLGLEYNTDAFGDITMKDLRLFAGTDGIAVPETCFIDPPAEVKRIDNPIKPLQTQLSS
ncbi:hypothetical protein G7047_10700 [Diaphorobacter sp. HDW4A]|uniref:hypothetical protein n=1 Tax=Diaphorobacter sp. HDW4A TaxID=2714924 RepID=UPI001409A81B|nr:hypothetical protein [Diaphorobacter sp. HDW4A]QIL80321.1 hypothetical protein G7047_10700 [Diaphorobacter sp. HDW4A]